MSASFLWRDRYGRNHALTAPDGIEEEYSTVNAELAALAADLASPDDGLFTRAYQAASPLRRRILQLEGDLEGWNRWAAEQMAAWIEGLAPRARLLEALHTAYDEFAQVVKSGPASAAQRRGAPTAAQRETINAVCSLLGIAEPQLATMEAAQGWLYNRPETNRLSLAKTAASFEWRDRLNHVHQLHSARPIEEELITITAKLGRLTHDLRQQDSREVREIAFQRASIWRDRISVLESDLEDWSAHVLKLARKDAAEWMKAIDGNGGSSDHKSVQIR